MVRRSRSSRASGQGDGVHIGASIYGVKDDPSAPESFPPTPDPNQGGGDGIIRTGWIYDEDSLLSSMIDDNGNVTLYLYDDLNRKVLQSDGLVVGSTLHRGEHPRLAGDPDPDRRDDRQPGDDPRLR